MFPQVAKILTLTMVQCWSLRLGKGPRCNGLVKNLRPSRKIRERILNPQSRQCMTDLITTRQDIITRGSLTFEAIFFTSATFPDLKLYAARKFTIVNTEGYPDCIWMTVLQVDGTKATEKSTHRFSKRGILSRISLEFALMASRSTTRMRPSPRTGQRLMHP